MYLIYLFDFKFEKKKPNLFAPKRNVANKFLFNIFIEKEK